MAVSRYHVGAGNLPGPLQEQALLAAKPSFQLGLAQPYLSAGWRHASGLNVVPKPTTCAWCIRV